MNDTQLLLEIWRLSFRLSEDMAALRKLLEGLMHWGRRVLILLSLWLGGLIGNLSNDQLADITAQFIQRLIAH